ncbi:G-type lectin S-receptor-like serine/threonine-protein kinase At1g11410 isoform X2 [Rosa chinensis]|uniref:G-type lectin S-receptor-like serine/threonine-protein kinase At1g11410 isoform X2 n=1 Tax=Rosa chinensis TaxID=74649 RepID=UPI000D093926|nr:G-type lectin S-receptor-like serine/threonine-protein kinase At1g11410 isoform X2 [Rosa chinensis]
MNSTNKWFISIMLILLVLPLCTSLDTITPNEAIKDGDILISSRNTFALGFFSPGNSRYRYVGIWYYQISNQTVVWVANRDNPVPDTSGVLSINGNGGLVIYGSDQSFPLWSANVTLSSPNNSIAKLLDTGNLVLVDNGDRQRVLWQGFDYPTNILLPFMKLGLNRRSGLNRFLTSWKSKDDPGTGNCSYGVQPRGMPQMFVYKDGAPRWRSVMRIGKTWGSVYTVVNNEDEVSVMYTATTNQSNVTRTVLDESGVLLRSTWNDRAHKWTDYWSAPLERCDFYGQCGPNGHCDSYHVNAPSCLCLPGFEPKSPADWYMSDASSGCLKKQGVSSCQKGEGFVKVEHVKVPESSMAHVDMMTMSTKACEQACLRNCSCTAYSSADDSGEETGCVTWHGDLMDTRTLPNAGRDLYIRVNATVLAQYAKMSNGSRSKKRKLAISLASVLCSFILVCPLYWLVRRMRKGKQRQNQYFFRATRGSSYLENSTANIDDESRNSDLPFFDLTIIASATNNFSVANKLGTGGFGSVYKGVLYNGKEIAVKRLSKNSGQGIEEFRNEVVLIAKLQHRNLVRILGCCIQDDEKMLIYEYVPNKSLDSFIFNVENRALLDWTRRFEIICGIARGILYLHQDSRLRIIHRDLKASNVLLDASMNPKIADFGTARIFRGDQSEANTNRVVGTYGYMSPEYAMEGHFSFKSDVYSFGILLLEIITGKKNSGYYNEAYPESNLVGHVWNLWREGNASEIVDSSMCVSYPVNEVLRCIKIALLCVQKSATDRPTMSTVVSILSNEAALASPRKPPFLVMNRSYTRTQGANSVNDLTCTIVEAR